MTNLDNSHEIYCQGHYVTVSRRDVGNGVRVRIVVRTPANTVVHDVFKDFDDVHDGDAAYIKQIRKYQLKAGIISE